MINRNHIKKYFNEKNNIIFSDLFKFSTIEVRQKYLFTL